MKKNRFVIILLALIVLTGCASKAQKAADILSMGEKYLLELDYEQAVAQFLQVVELDPMNPRGYTGAAEAYFGLGQREKAVEILTQGRNTVPEDAAVQAALGEAETTEMLIEKLDEIQTRYENGATRLRTSSQYPNPEEWYQFQCQPACTRIWLRRRYPLLVPLRQRRIL